MSWVYLLIAGGCEVLFAFALNKFHLLTSPIRYGWLVVFFASLSLSMYLLHKATLQIPMGTAYAVWTGIGAMGTVLMGVIFFNETLSFLRMTFLLLLIVSIIGLKIFE
jgi:quaternary ammonium compound-resistance protein SugE